MVHAPDSRQLESVILNNNAVVSIILLLFITHVFTGSSTAQTGRSWEPSHETVERVSNKNPTANFYEDKVLDFTLPDPLALDGNPIKSVSTWERVNRPEILELFIQYVYGRVPDTPYEMSFDLVYEDREAMDGKATLKQ